AENAFWSRAVSSRLARAERRDFPQLERIRSAPAARPPDHGGGTEWRRKIDVVPRRAPSGRRVCDRRIENKIVRPRFREGDGLRVRRRRGGDAFAVRRTPRREWVQTRGRG